VNGDFDIVMIDSIEKIELKWDGNEDWAEQ